MADHVIQTYHSVKLLRMHLKKEKKKRITQLLIDSVCYSGDFT